MKFLMLYPNDTGNTKVPIGIMYILALLKNKGHKVSLFDSTWYTIAFDKNDYAIRGSHLNFMTLDLEPYGVFFEDSSLENVDKKLIDHIRSFEPDIIGISITEDTSKTGLHFADVCKKYNKNTPIIVGGVYCMTRPDVVIANQSVDMVCVGEGEKAIQDLMDKLENNESIKDVSNFWVRQLDGSVIKNPVAPPTELETLPILDLSMIDERHLYSPFAGHVYKMSFVESQRGCPRRCTYCCNQIFLDTYDKFKGQYIRRKSVPRLIEELKILKNNFGLNFIQFTDDNFLLRPLDQISEFADLYKKEIDLPFWIQAEAWQTTNSKVSLMKDAGCIAISMGVETGSKYILSKVMNRKTPRKVTIKAFDIMHSHKIRTSANVIIGVPEETRETIFETIELIRECKPTSINSNIFIPYDGTVMKEYSINNGYLSPDYRRTVADSWQAVLNLPNISKQEIENLSRTFVLYATLPKGMWPDIEKVEKQPDENEGMAVRLEEACWDILIERGINIDVPGINYKQFLQNRKAELR